MITKRIIKSNTSIKDPEHQENILNSNRSVISRPITTFTSIPVKLVKYHLSKPITSRTKFIESIQKSTIICYKCKKLKPNTFLKQSQVSPSKICNCSQKTSSVKINRPQERKNFMPKTDNIEYTPLCAEGKTIQATPQKIRRFYSEIEAQKYLKETRNSVSRQEMRLESNIKLKFLIFKGNNSELVKELMIKREQWIEGYQSITSTVNFIWHPLSTGIKFDRLKSFLPIQIVNHFEFHCELTNKANLYRNLLKYCKISGLSINSIVPATYIFETKLQVYKKNVENFKKIFIEKSGKNLWIMKPSNFNRGKGIEVFNSLEKFDEMCQDFEEKCNFIVQKYIDEPLLFNSRKFDIRIWVLITHENCIYVYMQGYIRTSSEAYSASESEISNKFIHLTNNAVQKEGNLYGKYELGNQVSFQDFAKYLKSNEKSASFSEILQEIHKIIEVSVNAVRDKLNPRGRIHCFEIFGYDFIIDKNYKPWLIEVNTNPCLELSSPLLSQLIPRMLEDSLSLTLDKIFPNLNKIPLLTPETIKLPSGNLWQYLTKI